MTLIEDNTALVSWKPPDGPETVVTRYTILYASRKAWIAGEWQVLHREGKLKSSTYELHNTDATYEMLCYFQQPWPTLLL